jgi:ribosome biogenesis GTPase
VGGYVIDTPGVRQYTLWEVDPAALGRRFPEMAALEDGCRFANCTHSHEPECAVKAGVAAGRVDARRHASYLRILEGLDEE